LAAISLVAWRSGAQADFPTTDSFYDVSFALASAEISEVHLANPGFETDAMSGAGLVGGATGWITVVGAYTASGPLHPVHTGIGSLLLRSEHGLVFPIAVQKVAAGPGQIWDFQGWGPRTTRLPTSTFGVLEIVFQDANGSLLSVAAGDVLIGEPVVGKVNALPRINNDTELNTWNLTQARAIAPAGTARVAFVVLLVDMNPGEVYFDHVQATLIPEPTTLFLLALGPPALVMVRRKR
jgi:hypothetical protein